ncbi:MAG: UDP-glucose/GDP-mannose dehydrogenase family protein [Motiliproteus sp.]|nr:UDP-glucose/GDP-mannose dehydrogenase family protein [Motiliproteus sp.]MCW9052522.1 UDP-glucose/GDP-mannose dehydrogenase family protein [Motiliproteus sp.]
MKVSVYGCGLTGLVTAWALADVGNDVVAISCDCEDIDRIRNGEIGFEEPGLSQKLLVEQQSGRLQIFSEIEKGFDHGQVHFLALGSNQLGLAERLLKELAQREVETTVVNQSTFPVGTADRLRRLMRQEKDGLGMTSDVHFLSLPSILQEGAAIANFTRPHRIIVGSDDEAGLTLLTELMRPFSRNHDQLMVMSTRAAEFTKYAINGMLATKLSFMNEMANLADQLQVDIEQVRKGVGSDPRIGHDYIYPGCGFGGLSFSEDLITLAETVEQQVEDSFLLKTVLHTNEQQKEVLFRKLWRYWQTDLKGKTVAIWGASFKPNTDSIDNAPSLPLMEALWAQGVRIKLYDPKAMPRVSECFGSRADLELCNSAYEATSQADALMIMTEWKEFWSPDFERLKGMMKEPLIFDGRNLFDPQYMKELNFKYFGVGRNSESL